MARPGPLVAVLATGLLAAGAFVALGTGTSDRYADDRFVQACEDLAAGDSVADAFAALGAEAFRPACTDDLPCNARLALPDGAVVFACHPEDCSLQWRRGPHRCFVDATADQRITDVSVLHLAP